MHFKVRPALMEDQPPFLAGMTVCFHEFNGGSEGRCVYNPRLCPICNGTNYCLIPVVMEVPLGD